MVETEDALALDNIRDNAASLKYLRCLGYLGYLGERGRLGYLGYNCKFERF